MRDLRDPQKFGEAIQAFRYLDRASQHPLTASQIADLPRVMHSVPDYSHDESVVAVTSREYREKQQRQAAQGDVESARMCAEKGWEVPQPSLTEIAAADGSVRSSANGVTPAQVVIDELLYLPPGVQLEQVRGTDWERAFPESFSMFVQQEAEREGEKPVCGHVDEDCNCGTQ